MSDVTKVLLSAGELAMASNKNIILTKQAVTDKAFSLFASVVPVITTAFTPALLQHTTLAASIPKIYKGENYNGFPYVMMDYPAAFHKADIFAVRTMFWWGNFISITLHLSGKYKIFWGDNILEKLKTRNEFFVAVNNDEWQHHFEENNYIKYSTFSDAQKESVAKNHFLKVSLKYELHHWNMMQLILPEGYNALANLLVG